MRIHTVTENNAPKIIYFSSDHLHPSKVDPLSARKAVAEIKHEAVENLAASSRSILATVYATNRKYLLSAERMLNKSNRVIRK